MKNKELWSLKFLEEFLSINDYEGFKEVAKLREKELMPINLKDYSNISGRAKLTIQWQNPKILHSYNDYFIDKYEEIMKGMKESLNNIRIKSLELSNCINDFGDYINQLSSLFIDCGFEWYKNVYNDIWTLTKIYKETVNKQAEVYHNNLDVTINFHLLESNSFREFSKHKDNICWEFNKYEKDLQCK